MSVKGTTLATSESSFSFRCFMLMVFVAMFGSPKISKDDDVDNQDVDNQDGDHDHSDRGRTWRGS